MVRSLCTCFSYFGVSVNMNMKWYFVLVIFFCLASKGFVFTDSLHFDLDHLPANHRPLDYELQDEIKAISGSHVRSSNFLLAMVSKRVPVTVGRAMLSRYASQQMAKTMGNTILDRLKEQADDRTYTFVDDADCNCSLFYVDEHEHETKGFFKDLVLEVCKEAGKKCIAQHMPYEMCLNSGTSTDFEAAGRGILSRHFDGCGVTKTSEIVHTMALSDTWMKYGGESRFFVPVGNPGNFNPNDIRGKTVGFINGWYSNRRCLVDNKVMGAATLPLHQIQMFDVPPDLSGGFENNEIDAAFALLWPSKEDGLEQAGMISGTPPGLEPIGDVMRCTDGVHLGVRKDSGVLEWFNAALRRLKATGKYAEICRKAQIEHGARGPVECVL
ncbi:uncharacterized protein [Ptychodera flava]|uniref:uncharacterized protein isoform X2 n=1 Tax=Ptychodera flava TaxID=63121 RepID=UPI003969E7BC